ncbi:MAG: DNA repair protein RadA [Flavobacteriales bacterium]|nr:DNA repair protein RadA [Flavobacteriales bacterium]
MAKTKVAYFCKSCGHEAPKWLGKCPSCAEWNTFAEEVLQKATATSKSGFVSKKKAIPIHINEVSSSKEERIVFSDLELNRVLGGGMVRGSLILLGGEPGIGKSTLSLQIALKSKGLKFLYISGEESEQQIKMRAERIGIENTECYLLAETSTQKIFGFLDQLEPDVIVIDSIQTLHSSYLDSAPGSISQIRTCASELMKMAKESNIPVIIIGHITKEGTLAGPKVLEHMVDAVLQFEGDRNYVYRLLRTTKNRFGSTHELGIYEMRETGLREVANPSEILINDREEGLSGIAIAATVEGIRPLLIEVQALVSSAVYGNPQRSATGFDLRRLNMLLAVLEKRCGFKLGQKDVFLNLAGGIRIDDPSIDLAVAISILSSYLDIEVDAGNAFAAEIGLSGEIRSVARIEQRIQEAEKLGFKKIFISSYNKGIDAKNYGIAIHKAASIDQVFRELFG